MVTGVPGTSVDTQRTDAAKKVFAKYPDIKVVGEAVGMWSQAVARTELSKLLATRSWNDIDGCGCRWAATPPTPCSWKRAANPASCCPARARAPTAAACRCCRPARRRTARRAATRPWARRAFLRSPPYSGALALKLAVQALEGKDVPKRVTLPLPLVTNDTIKLCQEGSGRR